MRGTESEVPSNYLDLSNYLKNSIQNDACCNLAVALSNDNILNVPIYIWVIVIWIWMLTMICIAVGITHDSTTVVAVRTILFTPSNAIFSAGPWICLIGSSDGYWLSEMQEWEG